MNERQDHSIYIVIITTIPFIIIFWMTSVLDTDDPYTEEPERLSFTIFFPNLGSQEDPNQTDETQEVTIPIDESR